jgi:hypothetical protein
LALENALASTNLWHKFGSISCIPLIGVVTNMADDQVQHGIDDDPNNDAEKGAALGGLGGAAVGAVAGAAAGPVGAIVGAVVGGLTGAGASGLAVGAVDRVDNDNTVSGVGGGATRDVNNSTLSGNDVVGLPAETRTDLADSGQNAVFGTTGTTITHTPDVSDMNIDRGIADVPNVRSNPDVVTGAHSLDAGIQTGGYTTAGADTRGLSEKAADAITGDRVDDKTGGVVGAGYNTNVIGTDPDLTPGNNVPGVQTGGYTTAGEDTRGVTEKIADAVTGDRTDDKTGGVVTQSGTSEAAHTVANAADHVGGHNVVTGGPATTDSGKTGLTTGAVAGGVIGAAVGGPVGAVVGGTIGSLAGGVAGDADEANGEPDSPERLHNDARRAI